MLSRTQGAKAIEAVKRKIKIPSISLNSLSHLIFLLEQHRAPDAAHEEAGCSGKDQDLDNPLEQEVSDNPEGLVEPRPLAEFVGLEVLVREAAEAAIPVGPHPPDV